MFNRAILGKGSSGGLGGATKAASLSEGRELFDQPINRDACLQCDLDGAPNREVEKERSPEHATRSRGTLRRLKERILSGRRCNRVSEEITRVI